MVFPEKTQAKYAAYVFMIQINGSGPLNKGKALPLSATVLLIPTETQDNSKTCGLVFYLCNAVAVSLCS